MMALKTITLLLFLLPAHCLFCAAECSNYYTACNNELPTGCTSTAITLYSSMYTFNTGVVEDVQHLAASITSANAYISSNFTPISCSIYYASLLATITYTLPSGFCSADYLYKQYSLGANHYSVIVRFSVAYIGVWAATDYLHLVVNDSLQVVQYSFAYSCAYTQAICTNRPGGSVDCFNTQEYDFAHNTTVLALNFTSLTTVRDTTVQFWSVREILIATLRCDLSCATCFGGSNVQCTTCAPLFFFSNNNCLTTCPYYRLLAFTGATNGSCVATCPQGYYPAAIAANSLCTLCPSGCLQCTSATNCIYWVTGTANPANVFTDYLAIWLILIIAGVILAVGIIYKLVVVRTPVEKVRIITNSTQQNEERFSDKESDKGYPAEQNVYIEEIDFHDHVRIDQNPRQRRRNPRQITEEENFKGV